MRLARELLPPIAYDALSAAKQKLNSKPQELFDGDDSLFRQVVSSCSVYGEYGVGASTNWVYENTRARIIAAETSPDWAMGVMNGKSQDRIELKLIDVGTVGEWGRPRSYEKRANFPFYCNSIWSGEVTPDVVLVDGRFRVCCFLTSVLQGKPGLSIFFDDYSDRPHYHIVEEICPVRERCGRQVLFQVDRSTDLQKAALLRDQFAFVMD